MNDKMTEAEVAEFNSKFEPIREKIRRGEPIQFIEIDAPAKIGPDIGGGLLIDCPCLKYEGIQEAAVIRFRLTPAIQDALYNILSELRSRSEALPTNDATPRGN